MSASLMPLRGRRRVHWTTVLGLVLVPLTVAGVLLWGLWNPTERLDTVTAAVVNHDEPVEVDGQTVPLGRVLAGELIGSSSSEPVEGDPGDRTVPEPVEGFTWVLTDEDDAQQGLDDGRYATVVTIPENFSAAATSLSSGPDEAEQAHIDIAESDRGRLIDTALSGIVTQTATSVLNQQLGSQFVGGVFVGMTELHGGIGDAADGASQLADGGAQLAEGAGSLADGASQLADGTQQLSAGAGELSTGASQLAGGVGALSGGAAELSAGAGSLAGGLRVFSTGDGTAQNPGISGFSAGLTEYAAGARALASGDGTPGNPGLAGLATGVEEYTVGVNQALTGLQQGAGAAVAPLTQLRDAIAAGLVPAEDPAAAVAQLDALITQLQGASSEDPASPVEQLKGTGAQLAGGVRAAAGGAEQAAGAAEQLAGAGAQLAGGAEQLAVGAEGLAGGASELSGGVSQLATGASGLASGASQLATGTSELAANTPQLAEGASQLAEGTQQSADGARELAGGLDEAARGIPDYTEAQRDRLAETAVAPVEARGGGDELFNASGVPLFAGIALWAGALAAFLVLAPLWRRTREAARGIGWITLRSAVPAIALGGVQGAIAGAVLPIALGYDLGRGAAFFGLALLAGVAFALVVQGLSALLGGLGRFIGFVLLVIAFAVGIVSTVPGPLAAVGDASPIGAALAGFQSVATGASGAGIAAVLLALWALGGILLTALAVARARRP